MSDDRFRQLIRRAFAPLMSEMDDGPDWEQITDGSARRPERARGPLAAVVAAVVVVAVIGIVTSVGDGTADVADTDPTSSPTAPASTNDTSPNDSTTEPAEELPACRPGEPKAGIDLRFEDLIRYYNAGAAERLVAVIGDGPVDDPSLEPDRNVVYRSVGEWVAAADRVGDQLSGEGYGFGEPFRLFVLRANPQLEAAGIDRLSMTLQIWANQECEQRVEAVNEASVGNPCTYYTEFKPGAIPTECTGPFEPRTGHVAAWTGNELLVVGGSSGTLGIAVQPPIAVRLDGSARRVAQPPVTPGSYPGMDAFRIWDRVLIVTGVRNEGIAVLAYIPETGGWSMSEPIPDRRYLGGAVWTGEQLILAGGVLNGPSDEAWSYTPVTGEWSRLPDPGIPPVEQMEGVWTGTEAIFYGGYAGAGESPGVAWNPATRTWRSLPPTGRDWISHHRMVWTGEEVIVYSGHTGPGHPDRLLLYRPDNDTWTESAPLPTEPAERLGGAWTGDRLIIWGGYATYGDGHTTDQGAMYDPETDSWTVMSPSPLSARCGHSLTWTGDRAIVFGGSPTCGSPGFIADGHAAAFFPSTNEWEPFGAP